MEFLDHERAVLRAALARYGEELAELRYDDRAVVQAELALASARCSRRTLSTFGNALGHYLDAIEAREIRAAANVAAVARALHRRVSAEQIRRLGEAEA